jgi:hypothetical protein
METPRAMIPMRIDSRDFLIFTVFLKIEIMIKNLNANLLSRSLLDGKITNFPNGRFLSWKKLKNHLPAMIVKKPLKSISGCCYRA